MGYVPADPLAYCRTHRHEMLFVPFGVYQRKLQRQNSTSTYRSSAAAACQQSCALSVVGLKEEPAMALEILCPVSPPRRPLFDR